MAMKVNNNVGLSSLLKDGYKHMQGLEEAVYRNIAACREMTEITKSSFGPNGMNKLVVNNLDKLFVTNDAGTIMREVQVEHPAARLILMASQQQDRESGDATNLVIVLAGELLSNAEKLLRMGLAASVIVEGYEIAYRRAIELLTEEGGNDLIFSKKLSEEAIVSVSEEFKTVLKTVIGSKQSGLEGRLGELVSEAVRITMPVDNPRTFNPDNVRCAKIMGGSMAASQVIQGMLFNREPASRIHRMTGGVKVAVFTCPLSTSRTETKGTVLLHDAKEMLNFSRGEEEILESQIRAVAESGAKVLVTGDAIGDLALHFIDRYGLMAVKIQSKFDLRRLCRAVGATPLARLGAPLAEEMGWCEAVETIEIGSDRCTVFRSGSAGPLATIVLRGSTMNSLDDLERAIDDAVNTVKGLTKDGGICAGGGATEVALSRALSDFADVTPGVTQYAIRAFAEAFLAIPRILYTNAGFDATDCLARLAAAQESFGPAIGCSLDSSETPTVSVSTTLLDSLAAKTSAVHLAVDAVLTVLRVDQIIMSKPAGGPKPRGPGAQDQDDD